MAAKQTSKAWTPAQRAAFAATMAAKRASAAKQAKIGPKSAALPVVAAKAPSVKGNGNGGPKLAMTRSTLADLTRQHASMGRYADARKVLDIMEQLPKE